MGKLIDLTGQRFGRLIVVECVGRNKHGNPMWKCLCDCGEKTTVTSTKLKKGEIKSCGCYRIDTKTTHGGYGTRLHTVWRNMKQRCYNPNNKRYKDYGGRGITICDEWKEDFASFREWALQSGYDENAPYGVCTLDRIDNDKGYSPDNCRWATAKEQRANQQPHRIKRAAE